MDLITLRITPLSPFSQTTAMNNSSNKLSRQTHKLSFPNWSYPFTKIPLKRSCCTVRAKKRNPQSKSVLKPSIVEEVSIEDDDEFLLDDFDDGNYP